MIQKILIFSLSLLASAFVLADSEAPEFAKVDRPHEGSCYLKQIPKLSWVNMAYEEVIEREYSETAYKIETEGPDTELWSATGWYAFNVFLSDDCKYLVKMGNWARGSEPSPEDIAVAFYKNGTLLKSYSTAELIEDHSSVTVTTGHYEWRSNDRDFPRLDYDGSFHIKTIEGNLFKFKIETGEVERNH